MHFLKNIRLVFCFKKSASQVEMWLVSFSFSVSLAINESESAGTGSTVWRFWPGQFGLLEIKRPGGQASTVGRWSGGGAAKAVEEDCGQIQIKLHLPGNTLARSKPVAQFPFFLSKYFLFFFLNVPPLSTFLLFFIFICAIGGKLNFQSVAHFNGWKWSKQKCYRCDPNQIVHLAEAGIPHATHTKHTQTQAHTSTNHPPT